MKILEFPKDFTWGTAISSYQVEGNNIHADWWRWEQSKKSNDIFPKEASNEACDFWNRYEEDLDLCTGLNNNAIRLSLEWSRIEPTKGQIDQTAVEHYKKILIAAKGRGLKTFVTLNHFTLPQWIQDIGGWENTNTTKYFAKYAKICATHFAKYSDTFATLNEPQVLALMAYVNGTWPPNKKSLFSSLIVQINLMIAHKRAYKEIKKISNTPVGLVKNIVWYYSPQKGLGAINKVIAKFFFFLNCDFFLMPLKNQLDFIGLNYYFTNRIVNFRRDNLDDWQSDLNWWIYPKGLENVLLKLKKYEVPIYITENGVADAQDKTRKAFIKSMLISAHEAISKGVNLKGYFHWSLIDNFEWHEGYWPKFGLVEVDRQNNLQRKPRPSYYYYAEICRNGNIEL